MVSLCLVLLFVLNETIDLLELLEHVVGELLDLEGVHVGLRLQDGIDGELINLQFILDVALQFTIIYIAIYIYSVMSLL